MMAEVSDHAVLRYLERVIGINIEAVRRHLTVKGIDTAASIGCDTVVMGDGARLRLGRSMAGVVPVAVTCLGPRDKRRGK